MENDNKFPEQKAPEKNSDDTFFEVGKDGGPVKPAGEKESVDENEDKTTTLDKR